MPTAAIAYFTADETLILCPACAATFTDRKPINPLHLLDAIVCDGCGADITAVARQQRGVIDAALAEVCLSALMKLEEPTTGGRLYADAVTTARAAGATDAEIARASLS